MSKNTKNSKVIVAFSMDKDVAAGLKAIARKQASTPKSAMVSGLVNSWASKFVALNGRASMQKRG